MKRWYFGPSPVASRDAGTRDALRSAFSAWFRLPCMLAVAGLALLPALSKAAGLRLIQTTKTASGSGHISAVHRGPRYLTQADLDSKGRLAARQRLAYWKSQGKNAISSNKGICVLNTHSWVMNVDPRDAAFGGACEIDTHGTSPRCEAPKVQRLPTYGPAYAATVLPGPVLNPVLTWPQITGKNTLPSGGATVRCDGKMHKWVIQEDMYGAYIEERPGLVIWVQSFQPRFSAEA